MPRRSAPGAPGQLYNLAADPGETDNLYFKRPAIVTELKSQLQQYKESGRASTAASTRRAISGNW